MSGDLAVPAAAVVAAIAAFALALALRTAVEPPTEGGPAGAVYAMAYVLFVAAPAALLAAVVAVAVMASPRRPGERQAIVFAAGVILEPLLDVAMGAAVGGGGWPIEAARTAVLALVAGVCSTLGVATGHLVRRTARHPERIVPVA